MADKKSTDDLVSMFMSFGKDLNLPKPDLEKLIDRHKKNLEALDEAAKKAGTGATSIMTRQREMVQDAMNEISAMAEKVKSDGTPQSMMTAQAEFARRSFDMAIKNTSEIAGMAQQSGTEAFKVLQASMQETLEDLRDAMTKQTKK